jgi:hypothetical protein
MYSIEQSIQIHYWASQDTVECRPVARQRPRYSWSSTYDRIPFWLTGGMSAIYLLTVFFNLSNLFITFIDINNNFSISWISPCCCLVIIVDFINAEPNTTSRILLCSFLYYFFFCGRKSTTKCICKYTIEVTRQRPVNSNREPMLSVRSVPRC